MEDVYVVKDLSQLRALSDPLRAEIIRRLMEEPLTTTQLAELLGENLHKVYYHITELERVGLIQVVETRQKGNLVEKYYQPMARFFAMDWTIFGSEPMDADARYRHITSILEVTANDLKQIAAEGGVADETTGWDFPLHMGFNLTPEQNKRFWRRLIAVVDEFSSLSNPNESPNTLLTMVLYPACRRRPRKADDSSPADGAN